MDPVLLLPQVDCEMRIGSDNFTFYFPIEIGDFVLTLWTRPNLRSNNVNFSLTVFENGTRISQRDPRFSSQKWNWSHKLFNSWSEEVFSRKEVDEIIYDFVKIVGSNLLESQ
eukprot:TRINITY_DN10925_c0_g1_i1.p1 TRINITY_DN10925_c0_g1~~TRINITY_DN10925_c0_g1_i1.p1  ORF type:complete len:112 (+),score=27.74 TRINITY_DN10925_c0_g1_i1:133-468(+)